MDGEIDLDEFIGGWQVFQERSGVAPAALPEPVEIELSSLEAAVLRLHTETTHRLVYMKEERRNIFYHASSGLQPDITVGVSLRDR